MLLVWMGPMVLMSMMSVLTLHDYDDDTDHDADDDADDDTDDDINDDTEDDTYDGGRGYLYTIASSETLILDLVLSRNRL